jgi:hypothetical protein
MLGWADVVDLLMAARTTWAPAPFAVAINQQSIAMKTGTAMVGERANATIKRWKILTKLRCCPQRATPILAAITVLQYAEE